MFIFYNIPYCGCGQHEDGDVVHSTDTSALLKAVICRYVLYVLRMYTASICRVHVNQMTYLSIYMGGGTRGE